MSNGKSINRDGKERCIREVQQLEKGKEAREGETDRNN